MIINGKTFVANKKINYFFSYLKSSFDLGIDIIKKFLKYIIILLRTSNLDIQIHIIYPHKIFVNRL
jgi:hypothetical protein